MSSLLNIESRRCHLRPFRADDRDAVLEYQSNPDVVRFVPWPVRDAAMVGEAIEKSLAQTTLNRVNDYLSLALVRTSDRRLIGQMNAMYVSEKDQCGEIGYVVNPSYAGQGYATEACEALVSAMFATNQFHRIIARLDDRNMASRSVVKKLGFREEAHFIEDDFFKEEWTSTFVYAVLRSEWESADHS